MILSAIAQSIILSIILMLYRKGSRQANTLVGCVVLLCSLHFLWPLIIDSNLADLYRWTLLFPHSYLLAIGPLVFFYTKSLVDLNFHFTKKRLIHFLPVLVEVVIQVLLIAESIHLDRLIYTLPEFLVFRIVEFTGAAASIIFYGKKSLVLIKVHEAWVAETFSNDKDITLTWLYKLIKYLRTLWTTWLLFELLFIIFRHFQLHFIGVYLMLYILLGVMTHSCFWIIVQAFGKAGTLMEKTLVERASKNPNTYSRIGEADLRQHAESVVSLMEKEKIYLHETLTLRTLADRLQIDPNLLSYVLNNGLQLSFYDFVNKHRVEEVKRRIADPAYSHLKIVEVAYDCGFNSKATFNRVFKKFAGKSPIEYKSDEVARISLT